MKNVLFISLGCDKNLVDSEKMLGLLSHNGFKIVEDEAEADAIVVNTCCFIHDAKEESIETILEMAEWKKRGRRKFLVAAGCLAQRYHEEILQEIPELDAVVGTNGYTEIARILNRLFEEEKETEETLSAPHGAGSDPQKKDGSSVFCPSIDVLPESLYDQRIATGGYTACLKIAEGCNKRCSYCIIPFVRGRYRSFPMDDLVKEAENLAASGVRELILVAQEITVYGMDRSGKKELPKLLNRLCEIEGIRWIRLMYCYPEEINDEMIEVIAGQPKICHYLDMPIQHSEDRILAQMGRLTNREELTRLIDTLRAKIPDIVLRTTLITGFPGETEEEAEAMEEFVSEMAFDRLGVFTYSPEEGTRAALMDGQIPEEIKEHRRDRIMALQQEISRGKARDRIGTDMEVLIEGYLYEEDIYIGRTYMDAPGVDGSVFVRAREELMSGEIVPVRITGSGEYDLMGDVIYEDELTE